MHRNFAIFFLTLGCLFSGWAVSANTGTGFILVMLPVVASVSVLHLLTQRTYRVQWLISVLGFLAVATFNGSRPGSVILILNGMVLVEVLRIVQRHVRLVAADVQLLNLSLMLLLILAAADLLLLNRLLGFWSDIPKFVNLPRLRMRFSEASYLGSFAVALFFVLPNRLTRLLLLPIIFLTQSYYAYSYAGILYFRKRPIIVATLAAASLTVLLLTVSSDVLSSSQFYFQNSGLLRLAGLTILDNLTLKGILIGEGIGAGNAALEVLYSAQGASNAAGFFFSTVYDLGLLGMVFLYGAFARSKFDIVHLTFLLLNFGAGSFLIPVLMSFFSPAEFGVTSERGVEEDLVRATVRDGV